MPRTAHLLNNEEGILLYCWSKAFEENGIPFSYELIIKSKGWNSLGRKGVLTSYKKMEIK